MERLGRDQRAEEVRVRRTPPRLSRGLPLPPLVAVLRAESSDRLRAICEVLYGEGFRAFEFTLTTPGATTALREARDRLPGDAVLGIGTVLTLDDVEESADVGADFLVSPVLRPPVLDRAVALGVPFVPGTMTPTEAYAAWQSGAAMVKLWPVSSLGGPPYVKAVLQVLPDLLLMPSGGISQGDVPAYLAAGAAVVGLGSGLQGDAAEPDGDVEALATRARAVFEAAEAW